MQEESREKCEVRQEVEDYDVKRVTRGRLWESVDDGECGDVGNFIEPGDG